MKRIVNKKSFHIHLSPLGLYYYFKLRNRELKFYSRVPYQDSYIFVQYESIESIPSDTKNFYITWLDLGDMFIPTTLKEQALLLNGYKYFFFSDDTNLVKTVEALGKACFGVDAELVIEDRVYKVREGVSI